MSKPQSLICNFLQDDGSLFVFVLVLTLSSHWTILPAIMHAVQASKHTRKMTLFIDLHLFSHISSHWLPQVLCLKHLMDGSSKTLHWLHCNTLPKPTIFINGINCNTIGEHSNSHSHLLNRWETDHACGILLLHKIRVMCTNCLLNPQEKRSSHFVSSMKHGINVHRIFSKIIPPNPIMTNLSFPMHCFLSPWLWSAMRRWTNWVARIREHLVKNHELWKFIMRIKQLRLNSLSLCPEIIHVYCETGQHYVNKWTIECMQKQNQPRLWQIVGSCFECQPHEGLYCVFTDVVVVA